MISISETVIPGCFILKPKVHKDKRGSLVKIFNSKVFKNLNLETNFLEEYFSFSIKNTLRGLHFQSPPHEHVKVVSCVQGEVLDVLIDLRKGSPSFNKVIDLIISDYNNNIIYIPKGVAHGFFVLSENAILLYNTTTSYNVYADKGIKWSSIPFKWPNNCPIISERDQNLVELNKFVSPFEFKKNKY